MCEEDTGARRANDLIRFGYESKKRQTIIDKLDIVIKLLQQLITHKSESS